jgi:hypothetical protein
MSSVPITPHPSGPSLGSVIALSERVSASSTQMPDVFSEEDVWKLFESFPSEMEAFTRAGKSYLVFKAERGTTIRYVARFLGEFQKRDGEFKITYSELNTHFTKVANGVLKLVGYGGIEYIHQFRDLLSRLVNASRLYFPLARLQELKLVFVEIGKKRDVDSMDFVSLSVIGKDEVLGDNDVTMTDVDQFLKDMEIFESCSEHIKMDLMQSYGNVMWRISSSCPPPIPPKPTESEFTDWERKMRVYNLYRPQFEGRLKAVGGNQPGDAFGAVVDRLATVIQDSRISKVYEPRVTDAASVSKLRYSGPKFSDREKSPFEWILTFEVLGKQNGVEGNLLRGYLAKAIDEGCSKAWKWYIAAGESTTSWKEMRRMMCGQ